jgi:hypothetical protein
MAVVTTILLAGNPAHLLTLKPPEMNINNRTPRTNERQEQPVSISAQTAPQNEGPRKKKHYSALLAAARFRSPVHRVSSDTYFNTGLESTGIGMGYREWGEIT